MQAAAALRLRVVGEECVNRYAMKYLLPYGAVIAVFALLAACNRNEVIVSDPAPVIELDAQSGVYTVKVGREVTIAPRVSHADGAVYSWLVDGVAAGSGPTLSATFDVPGQYYVTFRVETPAGYDEEELRIDVVALAPPVISFAAPAEGLDLAAHVEYLFEPEILHGEEAVFAWTLDGEPVGTEPSYTFQCAEQGTYLLRLEATNEDGTGSAEVTLRVLSRAPLIVLFDKPCLTAEAGVRSVSLGRGLCLRPRVENAVAPEYAWSLDGMPIEGADDPSYNYLPSERGTHTLAVTVSDPDGIEAGAVTRAVRTTGRVSVSASVAVTCYGEESSVRRAAIAASSPACNRVYEYLPAPGQFVNDPASGFSGSENDMAAATAYAERRLAAGTYVSLGGFGGSIIVGFDHSIERSSDPAAYDFAVAGNQFLDGSEPGIVWVMQDTNGNGLPDDTWYELRGSESDASGTLYDYAVTYYRSASGMGIPWRDNRGTTGSVEYLPEFHDQPSYYPSWVEADSYTLVGTRLAPNGFYDAQSGIWRNEAYAWGYVDNAGEDSASGGNEAAARADVCFRIANAMNADGSDADLSFIDFIRVQTAVNATAGWIGENSTEVFGFTDLHLR